LIIDPPLLMHRLVNWHNIMQDTKEALTPRALSQHHCNLIQESRTGGVSRQSPLHRENFTLSLIEQGTLWLNPWPICQCSFLFETYRIHFLKRLASTREL